MPQGSGRVRGVRCSFVVSPGTQTERKSGRVFARRPSVFRLPFASLLRARHARPHGTMIIPVRCFTCGKVRKTSCAVNGRARASALPGARGRLASASGGGQRSSTSSLTLSLSPYHPPGHRQQVGHLPGAAAGRLLGDVSAVMGREREMRWWGSPVPRTPSSRRRRPHPTPQFSSPFSPVTPSTPWA